MKVIKRKQTRGWERQCRAFDVSRKLSDRVASGAQGLPSAWKAYVQRTFGADLREPVQ